MSAPIERGRSTPFSKTGLSASRSSSLATLNTLSRSLLNSSAKRWAASSRSSGLLSAIHAPSASSPELRIRVRSRRAYPLARRNNELIWRRERTNILPGVLNQAEQRQPTLRVIVGCYFGDRQSGRNDGREVQFVDDQVQVGIINEVVPCTCIEDVLVPEIALHCGASGSTDVGPLPRLNHGRRPRLIDIHSNLFSLSQHTWKRGLRRRNVTLLAFG